MEEEKTAVAREWLCKHVSTAAKSHDNSKRDACSNRGTVIGSVFYAVCAEAV
jgi:hypothetical protein